MLYLDMAELRELGTYLCLGREIISSFIPRNRRSLNGAIRSLEECCDRLVGGI